MYRHVIKRLLDIILSLTALLLLSPLFIVVAIMVRTKLGSPVLFKQKRPGKNEKIFTLYKFRTMTNQKDENGQLLPDEVRLTSFGKFLRSTSLDELPELINILKGEMSIIGPRPLLVKYLPLYNETQKHRHDVRPGLTGLAQINGRNTITWENKFEYDVEYVKKLSFALDISIFWRTIQTVLKREGINSANDATMEAFKGTCMNILFCSVGRRCELLKDFRKTLGENVKIVVTDNSEVAPAMAFADRAYLVPLIHDPDYIPMILDICKKENIQAVTTLIDPEIMLLAAHRAEFEELGVTVLAPYEKTAQLCFDKYKMYQFLSEKGLPTIKTYGLYEEFMKDYKNGKISFPVFVKPRTGSGSVGARKIDSPELLRQVTQEDASLIIQELMTGKDLDADVYVDTISHKPVAIFSKKKLSTTIGGANKTISFKDTELFAFVKEILATMEFNGPLDMDFFFQDGKYYLSEINPRFGGAYLHAYGAGVDFIKMIYENVKGRENKEDIGNYEEDVVMMMYDSVVIEKKSDIERAMIREVAYENIDS